MCKIKRNIREPLKTYLIKDEYSNARIIYGIKFFIGKYNGKRKIKSINRESMPRKCGNYNGNNYYQRFVKYNRWQYDVKSNILEFSNSGHKHRLKCKVVPISSEQLLLIEIK